MADLIQDPGVLGGKYSIVIHQFKDTCAAYMTRRGRKRIWMGYGATPAAAEADVLRYLDERVRPFVVAVTVKEPVSG